MGGNEASNENESPLAPGFSLWRTAISVQPCRRRLPPSSAPDRYPDDFTANYNMGDLLLSQGDTTGAIAHFESSTKADPHSALAATELGVALFLRQTGAAGRGPWQNESTGASGRVQQSQAMTTRRWTDTTTLLAPDPPAFRCTAVWDGICPNWYPSRRVTSGVRNDSPTRSQLPARPSGHRRHQSTPAAPRWGSS